MLVRPPIGRKKRKILIRNGLDTWLDLFMASMLAREAEIRSSSLDTGYNFSLEILIQEPTYSYVRVGTECTYVLTNQFTKEYQK